MLDNYDFNLLDRWRPAIAIQAADREPENSTSSPAPLSSPRVAGHRCGCKLAVTIFSFFLLPFFSFYPRRTRAFSHETCRGGGFYLSNNGMTSAAGRGSLEIRTAALDATFPRFPPRFSISHLVESMLAPPCPTTTHTTQPSSIEISRSKLHFYDTRETQAVDSSQCSRGVSRATTYFGNPLMLTRYENANCPSSAFIREMVIRPDKGIVGPTI
jgi:hypothetical protein